MTISDVLREIKAIYVPGTVGYYDQLNPNPWMQNIDVLEQASQANPDASIICERVVSRARELVERFRKEGGGRAREVTELDAFYIGDPDKVEQWESVIHQKCVKCGTKENLTIEPVGADALQVQIVCKPCKGASR